MARRRDIQPPKESNRVERLTPPVPVGYMLGEGRRAEDVLAVQAELLRSEGIDPTWPGFDEKALLTRDSDAGQ
jgi:hypothetical protein